MVHICDYVFLLLYTLDVTKDEAIQTHIFQQTKNSAQAMNLEIKAQHTMTEFDSYKIKLYSE
jgi:hypothetical protein